LLIEPVESLAAFVPNVPEAFIAQSMTCPDRTFLAERPTPGAPWRHLSYRDMRLRVEAAAEWLLQRQIPRDRSLLILSGNSQLHAILKFAAMSARVPVCPVSVNYALMGGDYGRLRHVIELIRPAVVFAEHTAVYKSALETLDFGDAVIVTDDPKLLKRDAIATATVLATRATPAVARSIARIDPDEPSLYMLTSGSTSMPKAVIQTQRMLAANIAQGMHVLGATAGWNDVMLDWLPWNHVAGGTQMLGIALSGGTLYIDGGKPMPGLFDESVRNLKEISVRYYANVPAGYAMLADALESDADLRRTFFSEMRLLLYGGAGLPQSLYDRLQRLAVQTVGRRIFFTSGYGATESTSGCMAIYFQSEQVGIGLPMPGLRIKLIPNGDRYELRMHGPMVTPGYLRMPEKSTELFDDEGYLRIGDTARFHDPDDIHQGLAFAGRLAEEFKLATGAWVHGGALRAQIVQACAGLVADALVCGENRDYLGALLWPSIPACRRLIGAEAERMELAEIVAHPRVREAVRAALAAHNAANPGSSARITRCAWLLEPPNSNAHEISDKGTINQNVGLRRRAPQVAALYAEPPRPDVILISSFP
jgi:feruloyl-CoA synthase